MLSISLLLTFLTVVLSAYIRLAEVGIGCEPWPSCYANLGIDEEQRGIAVLTAAGEQMSHRGARLAHRYIASALGIFVVVLTFTAWRQQGNRRTSFLVPFCIFLITCGLSLLGYYTPTRTNPLITIGNLLGGMSMLALLWWMLQRYADSTETSTAIQIKPAVILALCLVVTQLVLGSWSSANFASSSCVELFSCVPGWAEFGNVSQAYSPGRSIDLDASGQVLPSAELGVMSMVHRVFAVLTALYLAWLVRRVQQYTELKSTAVAISVCSISLLGIGVSMIWFDLPLWMLSLHNTLAACLLLSVVNLHHHLTPRPPMSPLPQ